MSYGYRLNVEDIFFKIAEENFEKAQLLVGMVPHNSGAEDEFIPFRGYPTDEGMAYIAISVVGWATALEAFTNLAWNRKIAAQIPEGKIRNMVIRNFSTPDKIQEIINNNSSDVTKYVWWPGVKKLFELRNELVHYRHEVVYQGFSFAPPIVRRLPEEVVLSVRKAAISAIEELGSSCDLRTGFVKGDYELATVYT